MRKYFQIFLAVAIVVVCHADEILQQFKILYDFQSWNNVPANSEIVAAFRYPQLMLPTNTLNNVDIMYCDHEELCIYSDQHEVLRTNIQVFDSSNAARNSLILHLSNRNSTIPLLRNFDLGDICYYGSISNMINYLLFVRNNVFVSISSDLVLVSVTNVASQIDCAIIEQSH